MTKTPLIAEFLDRIATLNDQLCFFLFNEEELKKRINDLSDNVQDHYITDFFKSNKFSKKIHVRLNEFLKVQKKNRIFTFGAYFSTSFELTKGYLNNSLDLLSKINSSTFILKNKDNAIEIKYIKTLRASKCITPDINLIDTLTYLRLRRNHFTHINKNPNKNFEKFINQNGLKLNSYWSDIIKLDHIDFTNKKISNFDENVTIELIKLLRIIIQELDKNLSLSLNSEGILTNIAKREFFNKPVGMNTYIEKERIKKLKKLVKMEYGINCTDSMAKKIVNSI